jgi:hypothetical protein
MNRRADTIGLYSRRNDRRPNSCRAVHHRAIY